MHCVKPQDKVWEGDLPDVIRVAASEDATFVLTGEWSSHMHSIVLRGWRLSNSTRCTRKTRLK